MLSALGVIQLICFLIHFVRDFFVSVWTMLFIQCVLLQLKTQEQETRM